MLRTRVIPCLLLKDKGLVKTVRFRDPTYVGDPINAVKIFNDKEVDELVFLDINATKDGHKVQFDLIKRIANECFMPFAVGGGISSIEDMKRLFSIGVEKVVVNTKAVEDTALVRKAADIFGSQSVVVSLDVKKNLFGRYLVHVRSGTVKTDHDPVLLAKKMEENGAGEIFLNSIDKDGTMEGYDLELLKKVCTNVRIPVIACGGAGKLEDLKQAVAVGKASAVSAGSMFVFYGPRRAVLINYPTQKELRLQGL